LLVVLGACLAGTVERVMAKAHTTTRMVAKQWMEANIPKGSFIAYDDYAADPPFFSPDVYLNPGTATKYEQYVPPPLQEKILAHAKQHPSFRSQRLRYYLEQPKFPSQWSDEFRKRFVNDQMIVHFYKMRFVPLKELYGKQVEYIVVSQGYYSDFSEDKYSPDNPFYYFNRTGVEYYQTLFHDNEYYRKLWEIAPSNGITGSKITIFVRKK
jgi:hypothetical protein